MEIVLVGARLTHTHTHKYVDKEVLKHAHVLYSVYPCETRYSAAVTKGEREWEWSTPIWPEGLTSCDDQDSRKSQSAHSAVTHTHAHTNTHSHTLECKTAVLGQIPLCGCLVHPGCTSGMSSSKQSERSLSHYFDAICEWQVGITTAWSQSFLRRPRPLYLNVFWVCLKAA